MMTRNKQKGSALLLVIAMVAVLALLGAASLRSAAFEQAMVVNDQLEKTTFQAAETGIEWLIADGTDMVSAINAGTDQAITSTLDATPANGEPQVVSSTSVIFSGDSITEGYSLTEYANYAFTARATGTVSGTAAVSRHARTISKIGPKP
jgi:Tfp pilus assembly protein PilX